jgi:3-oxoacyl-[acyl-carrier protein] reductase
VSAGFFFGVVLYLQIFSKTKEGKTMLDTGLENKVAIITGANNPYGIGAGIAKALVSQGVKVFVHYFRKKDDQKQQLSNDERGETFYFLQKRKSADEILEIIQHMGGEAKAHWEADTFVPFIDDSVNKTVEAWTNAPSLITPSSFDQIFAVNTRAIALLMAEFAKRHIMRKDNWGRIINISTDGAYCFPSEVSYGASKLAMEGYTRSAAQEFGQYGITVNIISPGAIQTGWITSEMEKEIAESYPMRRIGQPEDIADAVVFFASEQARWITGQTLYVGGGHEM